jgi:ABC-type uncharacterized transport system fused permease/ATPase subunit
MTAQSRMSGDGHGLVTLASIGAAFSLAQAFIARNAISQEEEHKKQVVLPPAQTESTLPPVQEGDESSGLATVSSVKPVLGPKMSVTPKTSGRTPSKPVWGLVKSLGTIISILSDPGITDAKSRFPMSALSASLFFTIISRSLGELFIQRISGEIDSAILTQNRVSFPKLLSKFVLLGVPVAVVQQLAHLTAGNLSSTIRKTLISALMNRLVLSSHNLRHPEELVDADRLDALMSDISTVSSTGVQLASERLKRITEVVMYLHFLVKTVGLKAPLLILIFLFVTVRIATKQKFYKTLFLRRVTDREQALKKALSRLQRHRDDVALWNGASVEKESIDRLVNRIDSARATRDGFDVLHSLASILSARVGGTALGLGLIAPKFLNENRPLSQYIMTARVLVQMCSTVAGLLEEEFVMRLPKPAGVTPEETNPNVAALVRLSASSRRLKASLVDLPKQLPGPDVLPFKVRKSNLCLSDVTGMSPEGAVLFQSLSLELSPGSTLLVKGPKGSGKSALLRLMAGTWPAVMGEVSRPRTGVHCVPSKPYLLLEGSLKDQVCYPDKTIDQERLQAAIKATNIGHLFSVNGISRSGSGSALMGDTDQAKLMLARLIYQGPKYALLDECWKHLDVEYMRGILKYLKEELNCGVVLATVDPTPFVNAGFTFDVELGLNNSKQPPRHEIIIHRPTN